MTEPALVFDSVYAFAMGLERAIQEGPELTMAYGHVINIAKLCTLQQNAQLFSSLSCEDELPWNGGSTLLNFISSVRMSGLTGPVRLAISLDKCACPGLCTYVDWYEFFAQFRGEQKVTLQVGPAQVEERPYVQGGRVELRHRPQCHGQIRVCAR